MTRSPLLAATLVISLTLPAAADPKLWTAQSFDMPESAIYDEARQRIVVSVIGGHPGEADGNGVLAVLSPDGEILDDAWITGLDAPKGMAIVDDLLLVADLRRLHEVDLITGTLRRSLDVEGAVFLNDVTSEGTQTFVSDFMANRIWEYADGEMKVWLDTPDLAHPNGVLLDGDNLIVASWGICMLDDFSTETPGSLLSVSLADQQISTLADNLGNLDGVVRIGEVLLVNDWITGALYQVRADGAVFEVAQHAPGLADIAAHGEMLLLPSMLEGTVSAQAYR